MASKLFAGVLSTLSVAVETTCGVQGAKLQVNKSNLSQPLDSPVQAQQHR
jgi:hypothetical protein